MKRVYFWSPHIDPQVATLKSVYNSLNSLNKYGKKIKTTLINVFGEWDKYNFEETNKIDLILSRNLIKRKFKGFFITFSDTFFIFFRVFTTIFHILLLFIKFYK